MDSLINREVGGRYRVEGLLGQGGMATVYKGLDTTTQQHVAIKLLKPEVIASDSQIVERFDREGELLRRLNHPHIVKVLETVVEADQHYVIMDFVGGGDLRQFIDGYRDRGEMVPISRVLDIGLDLSDALARAHRLRVIHRDIKPANVLIAEDGTPRLSDFGIAYFADGTRLTRSGEMIGTIAYLSPEACAGEELDARADLWAFGVMLYEMLTMQRPFEASNTAALIYAIINEHPLDLALLRPDVPRALVDLVGEMLTKELEQRIDSARLVGARLEAIIGGKEIPLTLSAIGHDTPSPVSTPAPRSKPRGTLKPPTPTPGHHSPWASEDVGVTLLPTQDHIELASPGGANTVIMNSTPVRDRPAHDDSSTRAADTHRGLSLGLLVGILGIVAVVLAGVVLLTRQQPNAGPPGPLSGDGPGDVFGGPFVTPAPDTSDLMGPPGLPAIADTDRLVIVAALEPLNNPSRTNPSRFIYEDLARRFETEIPFSNIRVRLSPMTIVESAGARQLAEATGAEVIIWGRYDETSSEIRVEVGSLSRLPGIFFEREDITILTDVQVKMTDERVQSLAMPVLGVLNVLTDANNDLFGVGLVMAMEDVTDDSVINPEILHASVSARWHQMIMLYNSDTQASLEALEPAFAALPSSPLLYVARALIYSRLGDSVRSRDDAQTARRRGPSGWVMPLYVLAHDAMYVRNDMDAALPILDEILAIRPDEAFAYLQRGVLNFIRGDADAARADLQASMDMGMQANFPHIFLSALELREGNLVAAQRLIHEAAANNPDPAFAGKFIASTFGVSPDESLLALAASSYGYFMLGQWSTVVRTTQQALEITPMQMPDLYLLQGFAYCNLQRYPEAEAAYTALLDALPDYIVAHLLRAEVRQKQGNVIGAGLDLSAILTSDRAPEFATILHHVEDGRMGCENFLDYDLSALEAP